MTSKWIWVIGVLVFGGVLILIFDLDENEPSAQSDSAAMHTEVEAGIVNWGPAAEIVAAPIRAVRHFNCQLDEFYDEFAEEDYAEQLWQLRERSDRAVASLSGSDSAEHLFVAASMPFSSGSNRYDLDLIGQAIEQEPGNARFQWHRLNACINGSDHSVCTSEQLETDAITSDPGNGAIWTLVSKHRDLRGDAVGALEAMKKVAMSPRFEGFYVDDAKSYERSLAAATDLSYVERMTWGISAAVSLLSSSPNLYEICESYIGTSDEWRAQCLHAAETTIDGNSSILHTQIALELQRRIYEYSGDVEMWHNANRRLEQNRVILNQTTSSDVQLVLAADERVLSAFVEELDTHGELAAMQYSYEETERLKQNPDYDPCNTLTTLRNRRINDD